MRKFFATIKVIYAFQVLSGAYEGQGWDVIGSIKEEIWSSLGGITQADDEGFSNEEGYHILWQFNDDVSGEWHMAMQNLFGKWIKLKMDLGNIAHRKAFMDGKVSKGVEIL